jgi:hypothetical protein
VVLVYDDRNQWTGNTSTAWNTAGNWSKSPVPGGIQSVLLPATGVVRELTVASSLAIGAMEIAAGRTVIINTGGSLKVTNKLINNGTIKGTGNLSNTNFINTGIIAPGSKLSIAGNFSNQGTIELSANSQLAVSGAVTIAGKLIITAPNVTAGQKFTVLTGSTVTGQFTAVTWPAGVTGAVTYLKSSVVVTIISASPVLNARVASTAAMLPPQEMTAKADLQLAPVPAGSYINLTLKDTPVAGQRMFIYNVAGKLMANVQLTSTVTRIDLAGWAPGVYFVKTSWGSYSFVKQ